MTLEELRRVLDTTDRTILELIAKRQSTIRDIARVKQATGFPLRDYRREREVLQGARSNAEAIGISPDVAESVIRTLIQYSLTMQERAGMDAHRHGTGKRALVIGGAGKMGGWFVQFLDSQGFDIDIADPGARPEISVMLDWRDSDLQHDFIVVATPLGKTNEILHQIAGRQPPGVVFDIGSLKTPLRSGQEALRAAGVRTASLHPMFGPDVDVLSGRHVVFIDLGDAEALECVRKLFTSTMAEQIVLNADEHDRLTAFVLGLSHAVNIAFFTAMAKSGVTAPRLMDISSTTFTEQFNLARRVAQENPNLYYEIQQLNKYGLDSLNALTEAVTDVCSAVKNGDEAGFVALMTAGRDYTVNRRRTLNR